MVSLNEKLRKKFPKVKVGFLGGGPLVATCGGGGKECVRPGFEHDFSITSVVAGDVIERHVLALLSARAADCESCVNNKINEQ